MNLKLKTLIISQIIFLLLFAGFSFAQSSNARRTPDTAANSGDKPLNIKLQPEPELTDEQKAQSADMEETAKVRVEFLGSGFVGAITPVNSLPNGLMDAAIEAAGKIQFEPERKNGKPVTIYKVIEYSFKKEKVIVEPVAPENVAKAEAIIKKAIDALGGQNYLQIRSQIGRGKFSLMREGRMVSFQSFTDVIVYPDREITEFKERGIKNIQANAGSGGWYFDGAVETLTDQTATQIEGFKRSMRTNIDNFLRGVWRGKDAQLSYVGRRVASLGKRNDVVKLAFEDGFSVEFEFSDEGMPMKSVYSRFTAEKKEIIEEDRFAQFREIQAVQTPFIVDHFTDGVHVSRVNYETVEFNKAIPDSVFQKPADIKALKKDLKL